MPDIKCPRCGNGEMHPREHKLLIRGYKVHDSKGWCSQCLVCAGYYDKNLNYIPNPINPPAHAGWYLEK